MTVSLPWGAWYLDTTQELPLPDCWTVDEYPGPRASQDVSILTRRALAHPLGSPGLQELAARKKRVMIAIDDTSRPTPTGAILSQVLEQLAAAEVPEDQVTVIVASGGHRAPTRRDMVLKLGEAMLRRIRRRWEDRRHRPGGNRYPLSRPCRAGGPFQTICRRRRRQRLPIRHSGDGRNGRSGFPGERCAQPEPASAGRRVRSVSVGS